MPLFCPFKLETNGSMPNEYVDHCHPILFMYMLLREGFC